MRIGRVLLFPLSSGRFTSALFLKIFTSSSQYVDQQFCPEPEPERKLIPRVNRGCVETKVSVTLEDRPVFR